MTPPGNGYDDQLEELGSKKGEMQAVVDTAISSTWPDSLNVEDVYSRIVPEGAAGEILDLERFLPAPRRTRGVVSLQAVDDFARYVTRHDDEKHTTVWVDADAHLVVAVLNDHASDVAAWGDHRAQLALKPTDEWLHWTSQDGKLLDQETFAEHLEQGLPEIVSPDGATMLELAQSIQGTTNAEFKAAHRLTDGQIGIQYVEEQTAAAGKKGEIPIPERFELGIAPFLGEDPFRVRARLRYRIRGTTLTIGYRLERPGDVVRRCIDEIADRLTRAFPGERVFVGKPRS